MAINPAETLHLLSTNEGVWYATGTNVPRASHSDYKEFARSGLFRTATAFRLSGSRDNTSVIVDLFRRKVRKQVECVEICAERSNNEDPAAALVEMRSCDFHASVGGFHSLDYVTAMPYRIAAYLTAGREDQASKLIQQHPAYLPWTFLPEIDPLDLAILVGNVLDPRWYVDHRRPGSDKKWIWELGIAEMTYDPKYEWFAPVVTSSETSFRRTERQHANLSTLLKWRHRDGNNGTSPRDFLRDAEREVACVVSAFFFRDVWLNVLPSTHQGRLFAPRVFFPKVAIAEAFTAFVSAGKQA